ncbi:MAG: glycosyltransferase family 2 protein, partial [Verrucomicrobia bacterium]|nr:glycosyltransferase family 2 protein [Verrucomicrobiota bacterium]
MPSISVIIPVYHCAERLPEHVECLRRLRPMVHEFIWVITESPDGSHITAREAAQELGGQVLEVPRGLYQAWNSGIARANGEFIYISTIGDTITPEGLNALSVCIRKNEADVVFSPPVIFPATQPNLKRCRHWTVFKFSKILNQFSGVRIPKEKTFLLQILSGASGLLGSCASCLFRASFLQSRPFPTEYHHYGDTAWTFHNLPGAILAFHPNPVAKFVIHNVEISRTVDKRQIYRLIDQIAIQLNQGLTQIAHKYTRASFHIDRIRDPHPKFGWW